MGWVGGQSASLGLLMEPVRKAFVGSVSRGLGELGWGDGRKQPRLLAVELNSVLHSEHCRR